ncbi:MAG: prepilin-type N-terminal cleavage/methylation domain-containing protein [Candidatus Kerfeldbacteria bacterium]|nr:prepilin-type N-terminal cleavage/methylation domain-containing protein [Candidatus Kerfeldbacteria bacterium]
MEHNKFKGFTLIELLVVISIIGLLSTLAMVALNNARIRSRDATRLSNMKTLQTAMEMYYDVGKTYAGACKDGTGASLTPPQQINTCVGSAGSTGLDDFLPNIANLKDPNGTGACANPATAACNYALNAASATSFTANFWQEGTDGAGLVNEGGLIP